MKTFKVLKENNKKNEKSLMPLFINMFINVQAKTTKGKNIKKNIPMVSKIEFILFVKYNGIINLFKEFQRV